MSEIYLKFWPEEPVQEDKSRLLQEELKRMLVLGETFELWNKPAFRGGEKMDDYLSGFSAMAAEMNSGVFISAEPNSVALYGSPGEEFGEEGVKYLTRNNVVEIANIEDSLGTWENLCTLLEGITGDKYVAGFDMRS